MRLDLERAALHSVLAEREQTNRGTSSVHALRRSVRIINVHVYHHIFLADCDMLTSTLKQLETRLAASTAQLAGLTQEHQMHMRELEMLRTQIAIGEERKQLGISKLESRRYFYW